MSTTKTLREFQLRNELSQKPGHLTWRLHQKGWRIFSELAAKLDVTPVQEVVLLVLSRLPDIDQKTLSELVALDRSTAGSVLMRLEGRKLITRRTADADKRARVLRLTSRGEQVVRNLIPIARQAAKVTLSELSEGESAEFCRLLRKLTGFYEPNTPVSLDAEGRKPLIGSNVAIIGVADELAQIISDLLRRDGAMVRHYKYPEHPTEASGWRDLLQRIYAQSELNNCAIILGNSVLTTEVAASSKTLDAGARLIAKGLGLSLAAKSMSDRGEGRLVNLGTFSFEPFQLEESREERVTINTVGAAMAARLAQNEELSSIPINSVNPRPSLTSSGTAKLSVVDVSTIVALLAANGIGRLISGHTFELGP